MLCKIKTFGDFSLQILWVGKIVQVQSFSRFWYQNFKSYYIPHQIAEREKNQFNNKFFLIIGTVSIRIFYNFQNLKMRPIYRPHNSSFVSEFLSVILFTIIYHFSDLFIFYNKDFSQRYGLGSINKVDTIYSYLYFYWNIPLCFQ